MIIFRKRLNSILFFLLFFSFLSLEANFCKKYPFGYTSVLQFMELHLSLIHQNKFCYLFSLTWLPRTMKGWKYLFSLRNSRTISREHDSFTVTATLKDQHSLRVEEASLVSPVKATTWVRKNCWKGMFRKAIPKRDNFLY